MVHVEIIYSFSTPWKAKTTHLVERATKPGGCRATKPPLLPVKQGGCRATKPPLLPVSTEHTKKARGVRPSTCRRGSAGSVQLGRWRRSLPCHELAWWDVSAGAAVRDAARAAASALERQLGAEGRHLRLFVTGAGASPRPQGA
jgi:hypothetical protein